MMVLEKHEMLYVNKKIKRARPGSIIQVPPEGLGRGKKWGNDFCSRIAYSSNNRLLT
jgi:hypothetical protein